jgi:deoxyinosine 3'endonuclease (endonuclease V)
MDLLQTNYDEQDLIKKWEEEQIELKKSLKLYDTEIWETNKAIYKGNFKENGNEYLRYIAGFDISFIKGTNKACSGLFVFDLFNNMNIVYYELDNELVEIIQPYVINFIKIKCILKFI